MTLLAPFALIGLALLAIPVVVHLFKPRHVRQTPFSSLRWLHLTQQRMARRIQWHQVLLFLLRAAFLTLLVAALSRPIWSPAGGAAGLDRIVVLDVSRGMGRAVEGRGSPCELASEAASGLIKAALPGDRTAILLTGATTSVLTPWTAEAQLYLPTIAQLKPLPTETRLDSAFEPILSLFAQRRTGVRVEIVFLTDNPANGWNTSAISRFAQDLASQHDVSIRVVDVALPAPRNAWISKAHLGFRGAEAILHVEAFAAADGELTRTLTVAGLTGVEPQSLPVTLLPGRMSSFELTLPASFDRSGSLATLRLEPSDELADDDIYFIDLQNSNLSRTLLIAPQATSNAIHRPGLSLEMAIHALSEAGAVAADGQLLVRTPVSVSVEEIAAAEVILLADVPGLNETLSTAVVERVRRGGGLAMFFGPGVEPEAYNRDFFRPLSPGESLLPAELSGIFQADAKSNGLSTWRDWNSRHPLLDGLVDPEIGDLAAVESRSWMRFHATAPAGDDVLARFEDGTPALIERRVDEGRVVLINGGADDQWCDLPRRKNFVPFVDRLLSLLQSGGNRRQFETGDTVKLALPETKGGEAWQVTSPSGRALEPAVRSAKGRAWLTLVDTHEAGFYRIESTGAKSAAVQVVVQPGRGDSRLEPFEVERFRQWWAPVEVNVEAPGRLSAKSQATAGRIDLEPWLVVLAGLVFLAEMILVHGMCPRLNPSPSTSHDRRRGFVAPLREREGAVSR